MIQLESLRAEGIVVTFDGVDVLHSVDFELRPGEIHALIGENGAGKSSLAKVLGGVYKARDGRIRLNGGEVRFANPRDALNQGIALIHQEPLTFPDLDIAENIFVGNQPVRSGVVDWRASYREAGNLLRSLGVSLDPHARVGGLSVAQQQMVELACALSHDARVWLFDETTAPLTLKEVDDLFEVMRSLKSRGCALALVTHHLDEVFKIADRITVLRDGAKVAERLPAETTVDEIVQLMVGRELGSERFHGFAPAGEVVLEAQRLTGPGFSEVDLKVRSGEVVGLAGLVGAGRTELARAIFGITRPISGSIRFQGKKVAIGSPRQANHAGIALVPEDRQHDGLVMPQAIAFNSTLANLSRLCRGSWLNRKRLRAASESYAERLRLVHRSQDQEVRQLSGGNQQKVVLSKWLMTSPKLLILDEPTRGIDVGAKHEVHKLIREQADKGLAVLMISSDLPEVLGLSDRVVVMREGRTVAELDGKTATEEQVMAVATGAAKGRE